MTEEPLSFDLLHPQPLLIVISGTAGVGKDSVIQELKRRDLPLHFVITATSRPPREGEVDGRDYFFFSPEEFQRRIDNHEFIEHANVYDEFKGIPRWQIEEALSSGKDVVVKVDVQGAATLRRLYPQALLIFVAPRSTDEWCARLIKRKTETPEKLKLRIETAKEEVAQIDMFDYIVVNADGMLEIAVDAPTEILGDSRNESVFPAKAPMVYSTRKRR